MGAAYDVETIVECARLLESDGYEKAKFIIAGSGPKYDFLVKSAKGLNNVEITGFLGAGDLARLYAKSHVGIACYSNRATQAVTYKFFDYMGAGLCIINSLQGEMSNIIERENVGYNYLANNPQELVNIVRFLCENTNVIKNTGENARKYTEAKGDSKHV